MDVVIVNQQEVATLLPMHECMDVMSRVLRSLTEGGCQQPLRNILWLPDKTAALGLMPAHCQDLDVVGLKAVTFFPGNEGGDLDTHQGVVLLFTTDRGCLSGIIDATSITAIRTAAVSGVATDALARKDAKSLAIVGSGVQARGHLEAMLVCRPIETVRVCSKTRERAVAFVAAESKRYSVEMNAVATVREAVTDADIVCTTTSSSEPVIEDSWLKDGVHINAVGSSVATAREIDGTTVQRSRLFVDRRESAINEAGDFVLAKKDGLIDDSHILGELGEVLLGRVTGRKSESDVTLFKSVGLAVEDLAAALHVEQKARATNVGTHLAIGGARNATA